MVEQGEFFKVSETDAWIHSETGFIFSTHFIHFSAPHEYHIKTSELIWVFDVYNSSKITNFCVEYADGERQHKGSELTIQYQRAFPLIKKFLYYRNGLYSNKCNGKNDFVVITELPSDKFFSRADEILDNIEKFYNALNDNIRYRHLNEKSPSDKNQALSMLSENRLFLAMRMLEGVFDNEEKQSNFMDFLTDMISIKSENDEKLKVMPLYEYMSKMKSYVGQHIS